MTIKSIKSIKSMKYLFLTAFISISLDAQEFDEAFLESLPPDVREELLQQQDVRAADEEVQYRRPSSFIRKPLAADDQMVFGYDVFSMMQSTFMPLNEPNFDSSYVLDFGDEIELQLTGQKSTITKLSIKRDGSINIPEIGKIFISGIPLEKASEIIIQKVKNAYIGVEANVTLTNVRDIQVMIAGNVFHPGPYVLNGNSNIFYGLSASGGPSNQGSYRDISLIRDNEIIETVDLYDTFIFGKQSFNKRLRSGDMIFVNPVHNVVTVTGGVNRPGSYELKDDETLIAAISFANGVSIKSNTSEIILNRVDKNGIKNINIDDLSFLESTKSQDLDKIFIKEVNLRTVTIRGAVERPGQYLLSEGQGLIDLVEVSGGYSQNAYPFAGILLNSSSREKMVLANDLQSSDQVKSLLSLVANGVSEIDIPAYVELIEQVRNLSIQKGRVAAEFDLDKIKADPALDIKLQNGDEIIIPEITNQVHIYGEILSPGTVYFDSNYNFQDYIERRGGYLESSEKISILILHPNGEVDKPAINKNIFMGNKLMKKELKIYPGSIIYVPRKIDGNAQARRLALQSYAQILSSLGVSLASISVLKD